MPINSGQRCTREKDRLSGIVIEAELLRAELAAAMITANIQDVRRRAGVYDRPIATVNVET